MLATESRSVDLRLDSADPDHHADPQAYPLREQSIRTALWERYLVGRGSSVTSTLKRAAGLATRLDVPMRR